MTAAPIGAVLLAGGRATRLDGAVKPLLEVGGTTLLNHALAAARAGASHPIVVVGPVLSEDDDVVWVREDPPFSGPAAAAVAGLAGLTAHAHALARPFPEWTLLLACDLPRAGAAVRQLLADLALQPADVEGLCLADASSRPQWLTGVYRTRALQAAASALPDEGRDAPVRALVADLAIAVVADRSGGGADIDTWDDLEHARRARPDGPIGV